MLTNLQKYKNQKNTKKSKRPLKLIKVAKRRNFIPCCHSKNKKPHNFIVFLCVFGTTLFFISWRKCKKSQSRFRASKKVFRHNFLLIRNRNTSKSHHFNVFYVFLIASPIRIIVVSTTTTAWVLATTTTATSTMPGLLLIMITASLTTVRPPFSSLRAARSSVFFNDRLKKTIIIKLMMECKLHKQ